MSQFDKSKGILDSIPNTTSLYVLKNWPSCLFGFPLNLHFFAYSNKWAYYHYLYLASNVKCDQVFKCSFALLVALRH